jgi:hypothetical protein
MPTIQYELQDEDGVIPQIHTVEIGYVCQRGDDGHSLYPVAECTDWWVESYIATTLLVGKGNATIHLDTPANNPDPASYRLGLLSCMQDAADRYADEILGKCLESWLESQLEKVA